MKRLAAVAVAVVAVSVALVGTAQATDDPDWTLQYGPQQIHAVEAWTKSRGAGVTIAIVDSGVQLDHPDLREKIVPGYDFADDDNDPSPDGEGHGTHVAGIAAAVTDNGIGIAGSAPDAKIMPLRIPLAGSTGDANEAQGLLAIENAIRFASDHGAEVINLSIGEGVLLGPEGKARVTSACADAFAAGNLCVVAAGNDGRGKASGYGNDLQALLVAANDRNGNIATFSQKADSQWGVTAPGVAVHSTWLDSGYMMLQGTSMAAPHVSGVAALLFAQGLNNQQVVDKILSTATPLNDGGGTSGAGLVNAAAAVGADFTPATTTPPATAAPTTTPASTGGQPAAARPSTTIAGGPEPTVVLDEGVVDDGDFGAGASSQFETAVGEGEKARPISETDGFTVIYAIEVAAFVAVLGLLGFGLRRVVLSRGIGQIRT